jgi:CDP-diacylglycerol---glycerol-3-phosphate 3-phosphatidyltransferase
MRTEPPPPAGAAAPTSPPVPLTPTPEIFTLPNQLTLARFVLAVVLFVLIAYENWPWCLVVFLAAAVTDWLDGYLARRWKMGTALGRNMDPLADKVLVGGAFIFLLRTRDSGLEPWMVTVVICREMLITGLRSYLEGQGVKFGADWFGKLKMWLQSFALIAIFVTLMGESYWSWLNLQDWVFGAVRLVFIYAMVIATALSGLQYLWKAVALVKSDKP